MGWYESSLARLDTNVALRTALFVGLPLVLVILLYLPWRWPVSIGMYNLDLIRITIAGLGVLLLGVQCTYLAGYRPHELLGTVTVIANVGGPIAAYFVHWRNNIEISPAAEVLVHTCSFWSGAVLLAMYLFSITGFLTPTQDRGSAVGRLVAGAILVVVISVFSLAIIPMDISAHPMLRGPSVYRIASTTKELRVPDFSILLIGRILTSGFGLLLANRVLGHPTKFARKEPATAPA